jgi:glycosyltransferase involved in cell wall biosynthesis
VRVIDSRGRGVSEGRNTGIDATEGALLAFIDDDAWAEPTWLERLESCFASDDIVGAGGRIVPDWLAGSSLLPAEIYWTVGCTYRGHTERPEPISRPIGCNMAFRRQALQTIGGFSPKFGPAGNEHRTHRFSKSHSNEELALALAVRRIFGSSSIVYAPDAVVHHAVPSDRTTWRYLFIRCAAEGRSKADVRIHGGSTSMADDRSYLTRVLVPSMVRYVAHAVRDRDSTALRHGMMNATAALVTGTAYGKQRVNGWRESRQPSHSPHFEEGLDR